VSNINLPQVVEQITDMVDSASAKGPQFASAVAAMYSLDGLLDLGNRLLDAIPDAAFYRFSMQALHKSVELHILAELPAADRDEARNFATQMITRQRTLHDQIKRSL
jgi:hypothetical protein